MKKALFITAVLLGFNSYSQEHFAGLNTSSRVGIMNADINPSELSNMSNKFEVNIYGASINVSNNKIGFSDLTSDANLEDLIFKGTAPVNLRFDAEAFGFGVAMKHNKWAFSIATKASAKLDIVDVDTKIGDAIANAGINSISSPTTISNNYNQRISGTTWGELNFSASRNMFDNEKHKFNIGATFKLLFPGSYSNMGMNKFQGTITNIAGQSYLNNTTANLNIAYSGGLANSFSTFNDYSKSIYGGLNGFAGDIGFNYQWKESESKEETTDNSKKIKYKNKYKINAGLAVRNIGSMTYKDANNYSTNYTLNIQSTIANPLGLNLNVFENVDSLQEVETILINAGYLDKTQAEEKEFKVKLPTTISGYADIKLISKLYVTAYFQQKLNDDNANDQITAQNLITITPRFNTGYFEVFAPLTNSEISGFNGGIGFRVGGFYLGSGSIITALMSDTKQADIYTGFRWSFL